MSVETKNAPVKILYRTSARAVGGRQGRTASLDGLLDVKLERPKELGGLGGQGTNPEQLFAAGYAACFISSMDVVALQGGPKRPPEAAVIATVGIGPRPDGGFGLTVGLEVSLPGLSRAEAETLVAKAHAVCPYSHSIRNNVDVELTIV
jgi:lipoyl-dependent peroxiredoxin